MEQQGRFIAAQNDIRQRSADQSRSPVIKDQGCWILELDSSGTILHSSPRPPGCSDPPLRAVTGTNLFDDVSGLYEMAEIKRRFKQFLGVPRPTESFYIENGSEDKASQIRICLTKTLQPMTDPPVPLVMMEISRGNNGLSKVNTT